MLTRLQRTGRRPGRPLLPGGCGVAVGARPPATGRPVRCAATVPIVWGGGLRRAPQPFPRARKVRAPGGGRLAVPGWLCPAAWGTHGGSPGAAGVRPQANAPRFCQRAVPTALPDRTGAEMLDATFRPLVVFRTRFHYSSRINPFFFFFIEAAAACIHVSPPSMT